MALSREPKEKIRNVDVEHLLINGFHTNYGGAFLLLPYLAALDLDKLVCNLGIEQQKGIATLQNVLSLVFLAVIGKKRVIKVEKVKDHGIAVLAGLSKLPSKSALYGFLDQITVACAEKFGIACAKAFKKQGIFNGKTVNLDGHLISYFGDLKIGKDTTLRNFSGSMKLGVVCFLEDGIEKYHGYLTNDYESSEVQILNEKSWRWRIENFFKDFDFLGLDALPSIELNKIAAMIALKLFAFNLMACLKRDMEGEFEKLTVESLFEEIIAFPALVKAKGDRIVVTFYGNYKEKHRVAVETLLRILDESDRNLPVSWLGNRKIAARFK